MAQRTELAPPTPSDTIDVAPAALSPGVVPPPRRGTTEIAAAEPAPMLAAAAARPAAPSASVTAPGTGMGARVPEHQRLGRYHVLKLIGEGGMGVVYSAFDEELDRRIAIKLLGADVAVEFRGRARLMREAQAMAKLSHPNVVHVYEVGQVEGRVFVAMEYIRGITLRDWLDQGAHDLAERLAVVLQAGEGLVAAHEHNIVHRDFKPENVMVAHDGRARVLDFGLARGTEDSEEGEDSRATEQTLQSALPERQGSVLSVELTKHGSIMGTPAYMSPEQHFGLPTSPASDQFNFCVVAYEAVYGVRPFTGDNRLQLAFAARSGNIDGPPPNSQVSPQLRAILVRGLAVDPADRWPSLRALIDALRAATAPKVVKSRLPLAAITALVVMVLALATALLWPSPPAAPPSEVEALAADARLWASRAQWVYPSTDAPEETSLRAVAALRDLQGELDVPGETQATTLGREFGDTLSRLGDQYWDAEGGQVFARDFYAQALLFDPSLERARERSGFLPAELAELRDRAERGAFSEAELEAADELKELARPAIEAEATPPAKADVERAVAQVRTRAQRRRAARSHIVADATPVPTPSTIVAAAPLVAVATPPVVEPPPVTTVVPSEPPPLEPAVEARDPAEAREKAKALVASARKLKAQGKRDAALERMFEATRVDRKYAAAWDGLRDLHFQQGAYHEAVQYGEKAVKLAPTNGQYHLRLGEAHWKLADYPAAKKAWTTAAALGVAQARDRLAALPGG